MLHREGSTNPAALTASISQMRGWGEKLPEPFAQDHTAASGRPAGAGQASEGKETPKPLPPRGPAQVSSSPASQAQTPRFQGGLCSPGWRWSAQAFGAGQVRLSRAVALEPGQSLTVLLVVADLLEAPRAFIFMMAPTGEH